MDVKDNSYVTMYICYLAISVSDIYFLKWYVCYLLKFHRGNCHGVFYDAVSLVILVLDRYYRFIHIKKN